MGERAGSDSWEQEKKKAFRYIKTRVKAKEVASPNAFTLRWSGVSPGVVHAVPVDVGGVQNSPSYEDKV